MISHQTPAPFPLVTQPPTPLLPRISHTVFCLNPAKTVSFPHNPTSPDLPGSIRITSHQLSAQAISARNVFECLVTSARGSRPPSKDLPSAAEPLRSAEPNRLYPTPVDSTQLRRPLPPYLPPSEVPSSRFLCFVSRLISVSVFKFRIYLFLSLISSPSCLDCTYFLCSSKDSLALYVSTNSAHVPQPEHSYDNSEPRYLLGPRTHQALVIPYPAPTPPPSPEKPPPTPQSIYHSGLTRAALPRDPLASFPHLRSNSGRLPHTPPDKPPLPWNPPPQCFIKLPQHSAPTPANSGTFSANSDGPLANSNVFPAAASASPRLPEHLGPLPCHA
ncbi:hypothetical protein E4T56_gene12538 [Termitomyces sp. T112]|nr:hypothetical protein E4T56_gene12538 [Termitomyces sp. T112]